MVTISVVMCAYREPLALVAQAIDSICGQTLADFEFLILDDGSGREELARLLAARVRRDPRIRVYLEPHRGLTGSLNYALNQASGEFIARQDADDWSEPERLARQVGFLRAHPELAVVGSDAWAHQEDGRPLWRLRLPHAPREIASALRRGNPFVHGATCFRRSAAEAVGGYRPAFGCSQDYDFFWRLCDAAGGANLAAALYHYRFVAGAVSAQRAAEQARIHRAARKLAETRQRGEAEDVVAALEEAARELAADTGELSSQLKQADHLMLAGHYRRALARYLQLAAAHPESVLAWGKLARWFLFVAAPPAREVCFR